MDTKRVRRRIAAAVVLTTACGIGLVCCSRTNSPGVEPEPARVEEKASEAVEQPAVEAEQAECERPQTPPYLKIVEQYQADGEAAVQARIEKPRKLVLETTNVKRLLLTREGLPLPNDRSIVLRVDGQGIEWTAARRTVVLERSMSGIWEVLREAAPRP